MAFLKRKFRLRPPRVTICIPTYNAATFITRTLGFATGQTMRDIRIVVSVDVSTDNTLEVCQAAASKDDRIEVISATERLGWGGNSAALVDRVDTPYFFFYYHDDIILPQYCDRLVAALEANPKAASANCSVAKLLGDNDKIPAHSYTGSVAERLVEAYQFPQARGAPLRSMIRTDVMPKQGVFEPGRDSGLWQGYSFITTLLLAGETVGVPEELYVRWIRDTGYVRGWIKSGYDTQRATWTRVAEMIVPKITQAVPDPAERAAVLMALGARIETSLMQLADAPKEQPIPPVNASIPSITENLQKTLSPSLAERMEEIQKRMLKARCGIGPAT